MLNQVIKNGDVDSEKDADGNQISCQNQYDPNMSPDD